MSSDCFFVVKRTAGATHLRLCRGYLAVHLRELSSMITPGFCLILLIPGIGMAYLTGDSSLQFLDRIRPGMVLFLLFLSGFCSDEFSVLCNPINRLASDNEDNKVRRI